MARKLSKPIDYGLDRCELLKDLLEELTTMREEFVKLGHRLASEAECPDSYNHRIRQSYVRASHKAGRVAETLVALEIAVGGLD